MTDDRVFLSELFDQDIYLIQEKKKNGYTQKEGITQVLEERTISYEGSNSSKVIVIIAENPSEEEMELLDKILMSVKLSRKEVALIFYHQELEGNISAISDIDSSKVISFGITSGKSRLLDIQTKYSPASIENRSVVIADSLGKINGDIELKRQLWACLKEVFQTL